MSERTVDPTRQGGSGIGPKRVQKAEPMTVDEALAYRDGILWRTFQPRADRAVVALAGEVDQLRAETAADRELAQRQATAWAAAHRDATAEIEKLIVILNEWRDTALKYGAMAAASEILRGEAQADLARFRAAMPGIIGCAEGDPATCTHDPPGYWAPCCRVRRRCVAAGLLPAVERVAETEDGS